MVRTAVEPASVIAPMRDAVWSIDRELPIARVRTMDQMLGEASADSRFRAYLLGAFGALGLILAVIGVYGVMSYAVAQRSRELGVRAALGARPSDLVRLVVKDAGAAVGLRRAARPVRRLDADRPDTEAPVSGDAARPGHVRSDSR